jgi:Domain of unknown function (DUF4105)
MMPKLTSVPAPKARLKVKLFARSVMGIATIGGACAVYYSTIQPPWLLGSLTILVAVAGIVSIVVLSFRTGLLLWIGTMAILVIWMLNDLPSNNRDWSLECEIPAVAQVAGNKIVIHDIRNFTYGADARTIPAYYDASFMLDQLDTVDLVSSYWSGPVIAHIFLTFGFQDGRHLAISIETRRQKLFAYSTIAGFFHHFELFYVVADERDLIGTRTDIRHEQVYLYRLELTPAQRQRLFLSYMKQINYLTDHPQWYNTLTDNCTTGILDLAGAPPDTRYRLRVVLSGYVPQYAYEQGLLNKTTSFAMLKKMSLIVRPPSVKIDDNYSKEIRDGLLLGMPYSARLHKISN